MGAALREAGYRVGQTPKPHLVSYRERIQVDGEPIPVADFAGIARRGHFDADEKVAARHGPSTEFEVLTAAEFLYFARKASRLRSSRLASAAGSTRPTYGRAESPR